MQQEMQQILSSHLHHLKLATYPALHVQPDSPCTAQIGMTAQLVAVIPIQYSSALGRV